MGNKYPTSERLCGKCSGKAVSSDPFVCADRWINIPYACSCGNTWVVKLPAITDYVRRQAYQMETRAVLGLVQGLIALQDPGMIARQEEATRRAILNIPEDPED